jgi:hypothetical protein
LLVISDNSFFNQLNNFLTLVFINSLSVLALSNLLTSSVTSLSANQEFSSSTLPKSFHSHFFKNFSLVALSILPSKTFSISFNHKTISLSHDISHKTSFFQLFDSLGGVALLFKSNKNIFL